MQHFLAVCTLTFESFKLGNLDETFSNSFHLFFSKNTYLSFHFYNTRSEADLRRVHILSFRTLFAQDLVQSRIDRNICILCGGISFFCRVKSCLIFYMPHAKFNYWKSLSLWYFDGLHALKVTLGNYTGYVKSGIYTVAEQKSELEMSF